jgi:hypothetical protein
MQWRRAYQTSLIALGVTFAPSSTIAAPPATIAPLDVSAGSTATTIRIAGTAGATMPLHAELYAAFTPELPVAYLSRQSFLTDATGHFAATLPIAPAFFADTLITVIVRNAAGLVVGRGSIRVGDPGAGP